MFFITPLFCKFFFLVITGYLLYASGHPLGVLSSYSIYSFLPIKKNKEHVSEMWFAIQTIVVLDCQNQKTHPLSGILPRHVIFIIFLLSIAQWYPCDWLNAAALHFCGTFVRNVVFYSD